MFGEELWQSFRLKWSQIDPKEKDELISEFVSYFASNPSPSFIFLFGLNKKTNKAE